MVSKNTGSSIKTRSRAAIQLAEFILMKGWKFERAGQEFGCSKAMIAHLVSGRHTPGLELATRIADQGGPAERLWFSLPAPDPREAA